MHINDFHVIYERPYINGETIVADDRLSIVYGLPIPIIDYEFYDRLSLQ